MITICLVSDIQVEFDSHDNILVSLLSIFCIENLKSNIVGELLDTKKIH